MSIVFVRQATLEDIHIVADILYEAALWLKQRNMTLWGEQEIKSLPIFF